MTNPFGFHRTGVGDRTHHSAAIQNSCSGSRQSIGVARRPAIIKPSRAARTFAGNIAARSAINPYAASQYVGASTFTWPAALFLWGPGSWTDLHRHHCVQLVMALDGTLRFRQRPRQRWTVCGAVLVRPDAWHEVDARGTSVLIAFVDAESELGAALAARTASDVAPITPARDFHVPQ